MDPLVHCIAFTYVECSFPCYSGNTVKISTLLYRSMCIAVCMSMAALNITVVTLKRHFDNFETFEVLPSAMNVHTHIF